MMAKYKLMDIDDFRKIKTGDIVLCNIDGKISRETVMQGAFYNYDADEPGWEIETENGFFCWDSVYALEEENEEFFAVTRWMIDDIQALRPEWTEEQCREWWKQNEKAFADLLTEHGNEVLQQMVEV